MLSATPFLTRFFLAQETKLKVPPVPPFTFPGIGAGTAATAGTAGATAAATAKAGFFSTVIGKIIIGVGAVVVLGVATVIGINAFNNRFEKPIETEEESESDSIDASEENITGWTEYEYSYKLPVESASDMPIGSEITAETTTETTAVAIAEVSITEETLDSADKFKVPVVSISGLDMTEINDSMRSFSEKYYDAMNSAEYSGPTSSDYTAYEGDGFISIVLRAEKLTDIYNYLNVYNISTETGELLGKDDFLSLVGMSSEDFDNLVAGTLNTAMDDAPETFGNTVPADGDWNSDPGSWVTLRTLNTSSERISAAIPFISDNGNLCFICQFNTSPYSSMVIPIIFDTVTHEHWYFSYYGWESFSDI